MAERSHEWWPLGVTGVLVVSVATVLAITKVELPATTLAPGSPEAPTSTAPAAATPGRTTAALTTPAGQATTTTPTTRPARPDAGRPVYVVYEGQTLSELAARFHISVQRLVELNHIVDPDLIYPGQRIRVS